MKLLLLGLGGQELILVVLLALLFFGAKRIPELMSGVGKGVRSFRNSLNGNDEAPTTANTQTNSRTNSQTQNTAANPDANEASTSGSNSDITKG